jgi:hypothetical protein
VDKSRTPRTPHFPKSGKCGPRGVLTKPPDSIKLDQNRSKTVAHVVWGRGRDTDCPHRPVLARLTHTVITSDIWRRSFFLAASRTRSSPLGPLSWLGVQYGLGCHTFSSVNGLSSTTSAGGFRFCSAASRVLLRCTTPRCRAYGSYGSSLSPIGLLRFRHRRQRGSRSLRPSV